MVQFVMCCYFSEVLFSKFEDLPGTRYFFHYALIWKTMKFNRVSYFFPHVALSCLKVYWSLTLPLMYSFSRTLGRTRTIFSPDPRTGVDCLKWNGMHKISWKCYLGLDKQRWHSLHSCFLQSSAFKSFHRKGLSQQLHIHKGKPQTLYYTQTKEGKIWGAEELRQLVEHVLTSVFKL